MADLSDRQLKIISTIAQTEKDCHITELARMFGVTHMAVSSSLSNLLRDGYIIEIAKEKGKTKPLRLTDKGIAAAVVYCGLDFEAIAPLHEYRKMDLEIIDSLKKAVKNEGLRKEINHRSFELFLNYNVFDELGNNLLIVRKNSGVDYSLLDEQKFKWLIAVWLLGVIQIVTEAKATNTQYFRDLVEGITPVLKEIGLPLKALAAKG